MKDRIAGNLLKPAIWVMAASVVIVAVSVIGFLSGKQSASDPQNNMQEEAATKKLSVREVRTLSEKGDRLRFEDFKGFSGIDVSSNLDYHIMLYGVEGGYRLIVRTDGEKIDSAQLERIWDSGGSGIDIRYNDVDEFIESHPSNEEIESWRGIGIGTPRNEVHDIMGEPDSMLSGLWGDIYGLVNESIVVFYYDPDGNVQQIKKDVGKEISSIEVVRESDNKQWTFSDDAATGLFASALNQRARTDAVIDIRPRDYLVIIHFYDDTYEEYSLWADEDANVRGVLMNDDKTWLLYTEAISLIKEMLK